MTGMDAASWTASNIHASPPLALFGSRLPSRVPHSATRNAASPISLYSPLRRRHTMHDRTRRRSTAACRCSRNRCCNTSSLFLPGNCSPDAHTFQLSLLPCMLLACSVTDPQIMRNRLPTVPCFDRCPAQLGIVPARIHFQDGGVLLPMFEPPEGC